MRKTNGFIFRARRCDNNEWTYGCLLGDSTIIPTGQEFEIEGGMIYGCDFEAIDVIPSTVVPLFDKNEIIESLMKKMRNLQLCFKTAFRDIFLVLSFLNLKNAIKNLKMKMYCSENL